MNPKHPTAARLILAASGSACQLNQKKEVNYKYVTEVILINTLAHSFNSNCPNLIYLVQS